MTLAGHLQEAVDDVVATEPVPGAVVGVFDGSRVTVAAAGTANVTTGAEMTPDTLFLFGSVTKVWVATLVMTLVDENRIDLDSPVGRYLPGVRLGADNQADQVSVRHLLTHASGLDAGDLIVDTGKGDDAIARYVALLADAGWLHEPGEHASYCNAGFVLAGRIVEAVTGQRYADALRTRVIEPLGLTATAQGAEAAVLRGAAVGHLPAAGGSVTPTRTFLLPEGLAPAGSTLLTTAADALEFGRAHLLGGRTATGGRLLSADAATAMAEHQCDVPVPSPGVESFGLGWWREGDGDGFVLNHTGGSIGGVASLTIAPKAGVAYVAFVNSTAAPAAHQRLRHRVLHELLAVPEPAPRAVETRQHPAPQRVAGDYHRLGFTTSIRAAGDRLELHIAADQPIVREFMTGQPDRVPCRLLADGSLVPDLGGNDPGTQGVPPFAWLLGDDGTGHPRFLYSGLRLNRRAAA